MPVAMSVMSRPPRSTSAVALPEGARTQGGRGRRAVMVAMSALRWTHFTLTCILFFFVALAIRVVTLPFDRTGRALHLFSCFWAQWYIYTDPLWNQRIEGREHLPWNGPAVVVANHQSLADIIVLFGLYRPFKWVSKASIFKVPFLGWNMRLNRYVGLVRGDRSSIQKMIADCQRWLAEGVPILMFPEGTRSKDGNLRKFKDGAFKLAIDSGAPVIPVVVEGTADALPKHGLVMDSYIDVQVKVLPPVDPAPFGEDVDRLREHVRDLIAGELDAMRADARREVSTEA